MKTATATSCHHCGTSCEPGFLQYEAKSFCCQGCMTIYQLFRDSGNAAFYEGKALNTELDKYIFLDNYEIAKTFINFSSEGVNHVSLSLPAVHCSSCVYVLENLPKVHEGVIRLSLDFNEKSAGIYYDPQLISLRQLASLLDSIGYPPQFDGRTGADKKQSRSLVLKIGIAGFCFGNIMLLSFPSYLGMDLVDTESFGTFFGLIMLLLSLPVVFYAGRDYLSTAFKSLVSGHIHIDVPIALGMLTLFTRSAYEVLTFSGEGYFDSLSGLVFFLLLGRWFQQKAYGHLSFERDYTSYFPLAVMREALNGELISTAIQDIEENHILVLRNNEIIPADATLLSDHATLDYSFVTGEDRLTHHKKGAFIYAGARNSGTSIRVKATRACSQSYLTQLWNNPAFTQVRDTYRNLMINKVSRYFTWIILVIAAGAGIYWYSQEASRVWEIISAVLIIACPCALALATPFTNGNTLRIFGRNKFFLRNADTAEQLGHIDLVVLDKTGTLTSAKHATPEFFGRPLDVSEKELISSVTGQSTHPVSRKITEYFGRKNTLRLDTFREITGKGVEAAANDIRIRIGSAAWITGQQEEDSRVVVEIDGHVRGYFILKNELRPGLQQSLHRLAADYPIILLSGDASRDASWLSEILPPATEMHFNMSPFAKLAFVEELQKSGKRVLMLGDGLNDAGALKQSDAGIAVTEDIGQFSPASDGILEGQRLISLPDYMTFSVMSHRIIIASFGLSFFYNAVGLSLAVGGFLTPVIAAILMPISSVTVVGFTTMAGNYLAKKLSL